MKVPSFREETVPREEICTFSVYHPMGALAGLDKVMVRILSLLPLSTALQPSLLVPLESGNTALVPVDSDG